MSEKSLTQKFVDELELHYPKHKVADEVGKVLCIGKDGVYRRLKGRVAFNFEEVAKISCAIDISLDRLVMMADAKKVMFDLHTMENKDFVNDYETMIDGIINDFNDSNIFTNSIIKFAYNIIPSSFYLAYDSLTRFFLFKWLYQVNVGAAPITLSSITIPEDLRLKNQQRYNIFRNIKQSEYIFDRNIFQSLAQVIVYFVSIGLISKEEIKLLKHEILSLIAELEFLAATGLYPNGNSVSIFLSNIDFDFPYLYFKSDISEFCRIDICGINHISSKDINMCRMQKNWIDSFKKYSILITQSGEMQRFRYFEEQRIAIEKIFSALL